jgi:hypothetical protein
MRAELMQPNFKTHPALPLLSPSPPKPRYWRMEIARMVVPIFRGRGKSYFSGKIVDLGTYCGKSIITETHWFLQPTLCCSSEVC